MIRFLQRLWWRRQRAADMAFLWPACKRGAPDIETARRCFMLHAMSEPCWVRRYEGRLWLIVGALE